MKFKILSGYNLIISFLVSLLGFATACEPIGATEYGVPQARFTVKGKVTTVVTGAPVANIKVKMLRDSTISDASGNYQISGIEFPHSQSIPIKYMDMDGTLNGELQTLDTVVEFKDPKFTGGDGHWFQGETEKEFNIALKPKK